MGLTVILGICQSPSFHPGLGACGQRPAPPRNRRVANPHHGPQPREGGRQNPGSRKAHSPSWAVLSIYPAIRFSSLLGRILSRSSGSSVSGWNGSPRPGSPYRFSNSNGKFGVQQVRGRQSRLAQNGHQFPCCPCRWKQAANTLVHGAAEWSSRVLPSPMPLSFRRLEAATRPPAGGCLAVQLPAEDDLPLGDITVSRSVGHPPAWSEWDQRDGALLPSRRPARS